VVIFAAEREIVLLHLVHLERFPWFKGAECRRVAVTGALVPCVVLAPADVARSLAGFRGADSRYHHVVVAVHCFRLPSCRVCVGVRENSLSINGTGNAICACVEFRLFFRECQLQASVGRKEGQFACWNSWTVVTNGINSGEGVDRTAGLSKQQLTLLLRAPWGGDGAACIHVYRLVEMDLRQRVQTGRLRCRESRDRHSAPTLQADVAKVAKTFGGSGQNVEILPLGQTSQNVNSASHM